MSPLLGWLFTSLLMGSAFAADIPCYYDEWGFHEINPPDDIKEINEEITLAAPIQDRATHFTGVPPISEPSNEMMSIVDLINSAVDPENTLTRNKAVEIASDAPGSYNIDQICYIYKYIRDNWEYVSDPRGVDWISSGSNTIQLANTIGARQDVVVAGVGDCDDYAVLMASLIEAIGGTTRIVLAYNERSGHAYSEVYVGELESNSTTAILSWLKTKYQCNIYGHLTEESDGLWLNLDWNSTHPGGPLYQSQKQSIAYARSDYGMTRVGLPPQYRPLITTGLLTCRVSDEDGNPLASTVLATSEDEDQQYPLSVDLSGEADQNLPVGTYSITAQKPGYVFNTVDVTVLEGVEALVDLTGLPDNPPNIQIATGAVEPATRCVYYTRDEEGRQVFKIRVYITGPDLARISSVKYSLHETFEDPEHLSTDASNNFEMILWAWGRFAMPITITTNDGNEFEYMYPFTFRSQLENAQRSGYRFIDATGAWDVIGGY